MEALDLKKFIWAKDHRGYDILAITDFMGYDVVIYKTREMPYVTEVMTVDQFCREFQATYSIP